MRAIFLCLSFFSAPLGAAVYEHLDDNGKIVFTDEKVPGSIERKVSKPAVITLKQKQDASKESNKLEANKSDTSATKKKDKPKPYTKFKISNPSHDESFRDNLGNVSLQLSVSPDLQTNHGHQFKVEFDGKLLAESWSSSTIGFSNIDRGTHTLKAFIVDKSGKRLKSSDTVTFHLQRFSSLSR